MAHPGARTTASGRDPDPAGAESTPAGAAYPVIAARNLFSPTRSEAPPTPPTPVATLPKPILHGVVVREGGSIAYLEDPSNNTKRVAGYREGDVIAGGTVQTISADRVVLFRPEGAVDVRLHDPSKPRPAPPAAPSSAAGSARPTPGQPPVAQPGDPAAPPAAEPPAGGRRVLPPNLLRRLPPQPGTTNAPQQ